MKMLFACLFGIGVFALGLWASRQYFPVLACDYLLKGSVYRTIYCPSDDGKPSPLMTSEVTGTPSTTIRILFIGNSFTSQSNLPQMLVDVASSDATNTIQLDVRSVLKSSVNLSQIWSETKALDVLKAEHWDYVVLQEQSCWVCSQSNIDEAYSAFNEWVWAIGNVSAKPVLFETWSDESGNRIYTDPHYILYGQDPDKVQETIHDDSTILASSFHMDMVPVGDTWAYVRKQPGAPELYDTDRHHPSRAGTFLAALLFYRYFTHNGFDHVAFVPQGMTAEDAKKLIALIKQYPG